MGTTAVQRAVSRYFKRIKRGSFGKPSYSYELMVEGHKKFGREAFNAEVRKQLENDPKGATDRGVLSP